MNLTRKVKPLEGTFDVAPYAGVFFLLVVFLLLHSSFAPVPGVRVQLPAVEAAPLPGAVSPSLVVTIDQNGLVYFDHQVVKEEELRERLTARVRTSPKPPSLLLLADESVRQGAVIRLATLARQAGIPEIDIGTRPRLFPGKSDRPEKPPVSAR